MSTSFSLSLTFPDSLSLPVSAHSCRGLGTYCPCICSFPFMYAPPCPSSPPRRLWARLGRERWARYISRRCKTCTRICVHMCSTCYIIILFSSFLQHVLSVSPNTHAHMYYVIGISYQPERYERSIRTPLSVCTVLRAVFESRPVVGSSRKRTRGSVAICR